MKGLPGLLRSSLEICMSLRGDLLRVLLRFRNIKSSSSLPRLRLESLGLFLSPWTCRRSCPSSCLLLSGDLFDSLMFGRGRGWTLVSTKSSTGLRCSFPALPLIFSPGSVSPLRLDASGDDLRCRGSSSLRKRMSLRSSFALH